MAKNQVLLSSFGARTVQVQKAHDWSESQCRVHKQGWPERERCILKQMVRSAICFERSAQQATEPQAKRKARSVLCCAYR